MFYTDITVYCLTIPSACGKTEGSRGMSSASALLAPQHTQRTPLRHRAGDSAPSPQTPLRQLHSCHLSLHRPERGKPSGTNAPPQAPPRWRMKVHTMENRATDPRNKAGEGHCWMLLLWQSTLTLGMKLIPPSLVLPQDQQSLQSFPKVADKALTRKDGVGIAKWSSPPASMTHRHTWLSYLLYSIVFIN